MFGTWQKPVAALLGFGPFMLATDKQVNLALSLEIRLRVLDPTQRGLRHVQLSRLTKAEISKHIQTLNQHTGFVPSQTLSTPNQKKFLATLEREVMGVVSQDIDRLTYAEADSRIKAYSEMRRQQSAAVHQAPVVDLFTRKAV